MKADAGSREGALEWRRPVVLEPEVAKQVVDRAGAQRSRVAEGEIAHGAHDLLELAGRARHLGLVKRVVWARSKLIDEQLVIVEYEHLDGEDAFELERRRDAARDFFAPRSELGVDR